jgi:orotidine-5'-phosphate decarboxylase
MGFDTVEPYLKWTDRGVIVLCRTSNAGARDFQDLRSEGKPLYLRVAEQVAGQWNSAGNCLLVVGATYPDELAEIRAVTGDLPFLVPGIGAQGGDVAAAVRAGRTADGRGLLINSSRGILYAGQGEDFADAARAAAQALRTEINLYR